MSYHHLNILTVFPKNLKHNLEVLQKLSGIPCIPVVKSNAYGHGLKLLAKEWNTYDIPFVCVDSLFEAYELQKYGYKKSILIMGFVDPEDIPREKRFHYACSDIPYALAIIKKRKRAKLHLFFDTGMHREGIQSLSKPDIKILADIKHNIVGIMTHFSSPDNVSVTQSQYASFHDFETILDHHEIRPIFRHICASGGVIYRTPSKSHTDTLARTGISYYGYGHPELLPALRCHTRLMQIKYLNPGDSVGYDGTFVAKKPMIIGVLPIGYNDGFDRRLSNIGKVTIRGTLCSVIGRVSMNITMINLSHVPDPTIGEEVILISEDPKSPISLERHAEKIGTIPYDILVHINKEMYRKYE